jgi:hypothetical protein
VNNANGHGIHRIHGKKESLYVKKPEFSNDPGSLISSVRKGLKDILSVDSVDSVAIYPASLPPLPIKLAARLKHHRPGSRGDARKGTH